MNIFILEDDLMRMQWFRERLIAHTITHAESCTQVDRFVGPYDLICLDHDLGGRQMTDHKDNGATFAKMIVDRIGNAAVIIHSYNADGAKRIQSILPPLGPSFLPHRHFSVCAPFRGPTFLSYLGLVERECA